MKINHKLLSALLLGAASVLSASAHAALNVLARVDSARIGS